MAKETTKVEKKLKEPTKKAVDMQVIQGNMNIVMIQFLQAINNQLGMIIDLLGGKEALDKINKEKIKK